MKLPLPLAVLITVLLSTLAAPLAAQDEVVPNFSPVTAAFDHERREVMIPMRDGVRLHTVIIVPRGLTVPAPIILTRTPYGADKATSQGSSPRASMVLPIADESLLEAGYIRVYQDIRGRYDSEGQWVMTLPPRGPLNPGRVDEGTDTWDTIEWLVTNLTEDNGNVGLTGVSYPGWLTIMGILDPHPALKAAVPMFPMVDGWIGDDFYHNGALRQTMFEWIYNMGTSRDGDHDPPFGYRDMYEAFLDAGSADAVAARYNAQGLPTWRKIVDNPAYNAFWSGQAVQDMLRNLDLRVPTLFVHGLFDQEDNFGGIAAYQALASREANSRQSLPRHRSLEPRPGAARGLVARRHLTGIRTPAAGSARTSCSPSGISTSGARRPSGRSRRCSPSKPVPTSGGPTDPGHRRIRRQPRALSRTTRASHRSTRQTEMVHRSRICLRSGTPGSLSGAASACHV